MCRANAEEVANRLGHTHAIIKLWNSGRKSSAAWLLAHERLSLDGLYNIGAPDWALYEIRPVFEYLLKKRERAALKLSQPDSVKLLPAPTINVAHVSRDTILESV